jgi:hemerythrin-like domain-containing protein
LTRPSLGNFVEETVGRNDPISTNAPQPEALRSFSEDHLRLRRGLAVLEAMRQAVRNHKPPQTAALFAIIDFFRGFGDGCHHVKEERILLPEMKAAGLCRPGGPVDVMIEGHHRLRELMGTVESSIPSLATSSESSRKFVDAAGAYVDSLAEHLQYEDTTVMPAAAFNLGNDRLAHVLAGCETHDQSPEHTGAHARYIAALDRIAQQYL